MNAVAIFVAVFAGLAAAMFLLLFPSEEAGRAEQDRADARRIADAEMKARLLRLDI